MRYAAEGEIPAILKYLRRHVSDCLYMYIDIAKYGIDPKFLRVWLSGDEADPGTVVMKYHTGLSFYCEGDDPDLEGVAALVESEKPLSITAKKSLLLPLHERIADRYNAEYGYVFEFTDYQPMEPGIPVERAGEEDAMEIARLVTGDESIGSYYEIRDLADQFAERMRTGFGRSYVIREDGKIIAHIASYAEYDGLATTSGLIVDEDHRSGIYGAYLEKYLVEDLKKDGFTVYTFIEKRLRKKLLERMGNRCVGEYGKLTRRSEETV